MHEQYEWVRLQGTARDHADLLQRVRRDGFPPGSGRQPWGTFAGLLGLASNELIVMAHVAAGATGSLAEAARQWPGVTVVQAESLVATVRPKEPTPPTRPGLYVHRFFDVAHSHVDEVVALSTSAWTTFESGTGYAAEPQGLFAPAPGAPGTTPMLLVTWYDGFASWETSRQPHPDATENFARRHALTRGTIAYATRLLPPG